MIENGCSSSRDSLKGKIFQGVTEPYDMLFALKDLYILNVSLTEKRWQNMYLRSWQNVPSMHPKTLEVMLGVS